MDLQQAHDELTRALDGVADDAERAATRRRLGVVTVALIAAAARRIHPDAGYLVATIALSEDETRVDIFARHITDLDLDDAIDLRYVEPWEWEDADTIRALIATLPTDATGTPDEGWASIATQVSKYWWHLDLEAALHLPDAP